MWWCLHKSVLSCCGLSAFHRRQRMVPAWLDFGLVFLFFSSLYDVFASALMSCSRNANDLWLKSHSDKILTPHLQLELAYLLSDVSQGCACSTPNNIFVSPFAINQGDRFLFYQWLNSRDVTTGGGKRLHLTALTLHQFDFTQNISKTDGSITKLMWPLCKNTRRFRIGVFANRGCRRYDA